MLDCSDLINEIRLKKPLWDKFDPKHKDSTVIDSLWKEISVKMGSTSYLTQKKWQGLRNAFHRELMRLNATRKSKQNTNIIKPKWKYFRSMMFLKTQFDKCDLIEPKLEHHDSCDSLFNNNVIDTGTGTIFNMDAPVDLSNTLSVLSNLLKSFHNNIFELEKEKVSVATMLEDDDIIFFKSLLPYMKSLDMNRKIVLKTKIQEFVCDFIYSNKINEVHK